MVAAAQHVFLHIHTKVINAPLKEMAQVLLQILVEMSLHARRDANHANWVITMLWYALQSNLDML